jgi:DNA-binding XRE family transcriptional regulator
VLDCLLHTIVDKSMLRYSLTSRAWTCASWSGETSRESGRIKGLTQEELAERSGFSQQYISGLEQGRRNPTIVSIYELATALGVSHMELVRSFAEE